MNKRIDDLQTDYDNRFQSINAIFKGRNNYRGSYQNDHRQSSNNRGNFINRNSRGNRNYANEASGNSFRCYRCSGLNHIAKNCPSKNF